jgi:hypothetical protein
MVRVSLQLEEDIVSETMRSVPTMTNGHFFILAVGKFFPEESIVLDIIDGFKVYDGVNSFY